VLSAPVVVIDFETTGLSPQVDRITEVAALRIDGTRVVERYVTLVNAGISIPTHITDLTGITNELIANAPPANQAVRKLVDFIGSDIVAAHNVSFDRGFFSAECRRAGLHGHEIRTLCTMRLARRLVPGLNSYRLASIATRFGVDFTGKAHRAESDALVAAGVLLEMTRLLARQYRNDSIDPQLLCRLSKWPLKDVHHRLMRTLGGSGNRHQRPAQSVAAIGASSLQSPQRWSMEADGSVIDHLTQKRYATDNVSYQAGQAGEEPFLALRSPADKETLYAPARTILGFRLADAERYAAASRPTPASVPIQQTPAKHPPARFYITRWGHLRDLSTNAIYSKSQLRIERGKEPVIHVETGRGAVLRIFSSDVCGFTAAIDRRNSRPRSFWCAQFDKHALAQHDRRWKMLEDGTLLDLEYRVAYAASDYAAVGTPPNGVNVDDPNVGERYIPASKIEDFKP